MCVREKEADEKLLMRKNNAGNICCLRKYSSIDRESTNEQLAKQLAHQMREQQ